jgi:hypothetical protein
MFFTHEKEDCCGLTEKPRRIRALSQLASRRGAPERTFQASDPICQFIRQTPRPDWRQWVHRFTPPAQPKQPPLRQSVIDR